MKEKIYTIPINDSFEADCGCPFCNLEDENEISEVEYTLGPSMMEPDSRENSNEKGFCARHLNMMIKSDKKLPLALILSTHLKLEQEKLNKKEFKKSGFLKKEKEIKNTCVVCETVEYDRKRYTDTFFHMLKKQEGFKEKVENCRSICMVHGKLLLENAPSKEEFELVKRMLQNSLSDVTEGLSGFVDMFDYRADKDNMEKYRDAVKNGVNTAGGSIKNL